jgi:hypothetical protein
MKSFQPPTIPILPLDDSHTLDASTKDGRKGGRPTYPQTFGAQLRQKKVTSLLKKDLLQKFEKEISTGDLSTGQNLHFI